MSIKKREECLNKIEEDMTNTLKKYDFKSCANKMWLRKWGWRSDHIYILSKSSMLLINLCVWVPPEDGSQLDYEYVGFINLGTCVGNNSAGYEFPRWFESYGKFYRRLNEDLEKGLKWFERFWTPQLCNKYIQENATNIESPGARYVQKYLLSLPLEAANGRVLINLHHKYPNDYSRALFDLDYKGQLPKTEGDEENDI